VSATEPAYRVVHRAAPEVSDAFVARLVAEGIDAIALDHPGFLVLLVTFGTYRVRIAVREDQVVEAERVMRVWDEAAGPIVRDLSRALGRQALQASLPVAIGALVVLFAVDGWDRLPWFACALPALFLVSFLALSMIARARER